MAMTNQRTALLYVGPRERGWEIQQAVEAVGWTIFVAGHRMEALAMYVFYHPTLVVLDAAADPDTASEVLFHLRSIQAQPILVLAADRENGTWRARGESFVQVLSASLSTTDLVRQLASLIECSRQKQGATIGHQTTAPGGHPNRHLTQEVC